MKNVNTELATIYQQSLLMTEYTFRISIMMRALNVMVTIFANESWKKRMDPTMITQPWKIDFHTQIRNVLNERDLPF